MFRAGLAALTALYLLQIFTPLRLDNDSVVYLLLGVGLSEGTALLDVGLPLGYPAYMSLLDRAGIASSISIVLSNCVFLATGVASVWYMLGPEAETRRRWTVLLSLLAVPIVRSIAMPLPEAMFFGISLLCLAVMTAADKRHGARRLQLLIAAIVLTALAITVRLVGFALVPALLWTLFARSFQRRGDMSKLDKSLAIGAVVVIALVAAFLLRDSFEKYASEGSMRIGEFLKHLRGMLLTIGELVSNLPLSRFRDYRTGFLALGIAATLVLLAGLRIRLARTPAGVYLISFLTLLFLWPYEAVRLWMPIIPLLIAWVATAPRRYRANRAWTWLGRAYVAWFIVTGLAALAYTSRITLSGDNFANVYGRAGGLSHPDSLGRIDTLHNANAMRLMKRYGRPF
ncbi:MAG TPA: hypothetical protein VM939_06280 [Gemmatimonadaceae bacterium]|nr:hypothetical protein [Gemmatimonadaceae bacterium]